VRVFVGDQRGDHQVFYLILESVVEVQPRRTCEFVLCCSCGNKRETCESKISSVNSL